VVQTEPEDTKGTEGTEGTKGEPTETKQEKPTEDKQVPAEASTKVDIVPNETVPSDKGKAPEKALDDKRKVNVETYLLLSLFPPLSFANLVYSHLKW
jgi:hypothetical protein